MMQIPKEGPRVRFSPDLARMLGFESNKFYSIPEKAVRKVVDLTQSIHSAYVYCDLLEHVTVGDTKAPLLRIVDFPNDNRQGNVHHNLNPVLYIPLLKKCLDTTEINVMADTGLPVTFVSGKSFVVLEFRHIGHPYITI